MVAVQTFEQHAATLSGGRLRRISAEHLDILRQRKGRSFVYIGTAGRRIADAPTLQRIRSLAIPPAYEDVRIASDAKAHLQATGRDAAGRTQYRYHPSWSEVRETRKAARLAALCDVLPRIRQQVARDLRRPGVDRQRVAAAVVTVIDRTHIRIGCDDYVHSGRSRGAATLLKRQVTCMGDDLHLAFRGKGGRPIETAVKAKGLKRLYPRLLRMPGPRLFQYRDENGALQKITSRHVNAYLGEIAGAPITAKDFRTLAGTALAAQRLARVKPAVGARARNAQITEVMKVVAEDLCNTPAVVRKSYVHARLIKAFESGDLAKRWGRTRLTNLSRAEAVVAALFRLNGA
jgi:DNA topoisomerase-1